MVSQQQAYEFNIGFIERLKHWYFVSGICWRVFGVLFGGTRHYFIYKNIDVSKQCLAHLHLL